MKLTIKMHDYTLEMDHPDIPDNFQYDIVSLGVSYDGYYPALSFYKDDKCIAIYYFENNSFVLK